jgi:hypothetical protein
MQLLRMTTRRWLLAVAVAAVIAAGVDCSVIGMSILILIHAARRPHPVHQTTAILLTLLTGILLWANLRPSVWQEEFPSARQLVRDLGLGAQNRKEVFRREFAVRE